MECFDRKGLHRLQNSFVADEDDLCGRNVLLLTSFCHCYEKCSNISILLPHHHRHFVNTLVRLPVVKVVVGSSFCTPHCLHLLPSFIPVKM